MQEFNRRVFMASLGAASVAGLAAAPLAARSHRKFFERIGKPIGLQLYTLGPDAGRDIDATFAQVAQIGYREIELPNLLGKAPADLAAAAGRAGLKIASLHLPLLESAGPMGLSLGSDPAQIADALGALNAHWGVAPILLLPADFKMGPGESFGTAIGRAVAAAGEDHWKRTADLLNRKASALKPLGIKVGYHNHNLEFAPLGKTTGWEILRKETDPGLVFFEVDIGWVATAGLDPVHFLERMRGRVRLLHVKDVAADNPKSYAISMKPAEVGSGVLNWSRILSSAQRAGVEHYLVEQEPPFVIPRIEAAAKSYAYLSRLEA